MIFCLWRERRNGLWVGGRVGKYPLHCFSQNTRPFGSQTMKICLAHDGGPRPRSFFMGESNWSRWSASTSPFTLFSD